MEEKVVNDLGFESTLYEVDTLDQIKALFARQYPDLNAIANEYTKWQWTSKIHSLRVGLNGFESKILFEVTTGLYQEEPRFMYTKAMVISCAPDAEGKVKEPYKEPELYPFDVQKFFEKMNSKNMTIEKISQHPRISTPESTLRYYFKIGKMPFGTRWVIESILKNEDEERE